MQGTLAKLKSEWHAPVQYFLPVGEAQVPLNPLLGQRVQLQFTGRIFCVNCGRKTTRSFDQGYCFPCFRTLAQCDTCIVKPEQCHFAAGTCREPDWAQQFCMRPHTVYLANSSGLKVGITRDTQLPTRWIDQGAVQAMPLFRVQSRFQAGQVEVTLAKWVSDKTRWQAMLKNQVTVLDLPAERERLLQQCDADLAPLRQMLGKAALQLVREVSPLSIQYPVLEYPVKVVSLDPARTPRVQGTLLGIKGQYLLLDTGVLNIRKHAGYEVVWGG